MDCVNEYEMNTGPVSFIFIHSALWSFVENTSSVFTFIHVQFAALLVNIREYSCRTIHDIHDIHVQFGALGGSCTRH
tara:strand:+ start:452 stop:682 length:231 start_codon:yes stop_codon:yes gene_type:complete